MHEPIGGYIIMNIKYVVGIPVETIKWADVSPLRTRKEPVGVRTDLNRSAGWTFHTESTGPASDSDEIRRVFWSLFGPVTPTGPNKSVA